VYSDAETCIDCLATLFWCVQHDEWCVNRVPGVVVWVDVDGVVALFHLFQRNRRFADTEMLCSLGDAHTVFVGESPMRGSPESGDFHGGRSGFLYQRRARDARGRRVFLERSVLHRVLSA